MILSYIMVLVKADSHCILILQITWTGIWTKAIKLGYFPRAFDLELELERK